MSKILSKLFGLMQAAQLIDSGNLPGVPQDKAKMIDHGSFDRHFYNRLPLKRRDGKWRVKK